MRLFGKWVQALFWPGGRRWIALTVPSVLVFLARLLHHYILPMQPDLFLALIWEPKWWTWGLAILAGVLIASYMAWREQFFITQELSGRPGVVIEVTDEGRFILHNANDYAALDVSVQDIKVPLPSRVIAERTGSSEAFGLPDERTDNEWVVKFETQQNLTKDSVGELKYVIENMGTLQNRDITNLMKQLATDAEVELPLTLVFSNLGEPKRTWHSHYKLVFNLGYKCPRCTHVGVGEVSQKTARCSFCVVPPRGAT